jgi:hypothetical protein
VIRTGAFYIDLDIKGWHFFGEADPRDFSSSGADPTIRDVRFEKRGGVLTFSVCVHDLESPEKLTAAYRFRLARIKHENKSRVVYSGEIARNRPMDLVGGDDEEDPGDGEEGNELLQAPPPLDCVELSKLKLEGKTRYGVIKISDHKD